MICPSNLIDWSTVPKIAIQVLLTRRGRTSMQHSVFHTDDIHRCVSIGEIKTRTFPVVVHIPTGHMLHTFASTGSEIDSSKAHEFKLFALSTHIPLDYSSICRDRH